MFGQDMCHTTFHASKVDLHGLLGERTLNLAASSILEAAEPAYAVHTMYII